MKLVYVITILFIASFIIAGINLWGIRCKDLELREKIYAKRILEHQYANLQNDFKIRDIEREEVIENLQKENRSLKEKLFKENDIKGVIHFAAESHVDNSIKNPDAFIQTNINGTFNLIDVAFKSWMEAPSKIKSGYKDCRFHHISTDEVYGTLGETGYFTETTAYAPNSPYSASKASSDFIVRAYHHTFGMNITTSNCSNNYGPKQHNEKLIPHMIKQALEEKPLPIYGKGLNIRDWLYVLDHCKAIDLIFHKGKSGETYNIGGHNERNNITIVNKICEILDEKMPRKNGAKYSELIKFVEDRAGHDFRYAIDATKLETELGWKAEETFDTGIIKTIDWYLEK